MQLIKGINVVSISVTDLDVARNFYGEVLGLGTPVYDLPQAGWVEFQSGAPNGNVSVTTAEPGWSPNTGTTVVFNTDDCEATYQQLLARGVRCEEPVLFPGFVTFCNFYDPFGNRLQLCSPAPAA